MNNLPIEKSQPRGANLTRREFVSATARISGAIAASLALGGFSEAMPFPSRAPAVSDVVMMSAVDLSKAIHAKQVSCREVMTAYLDQIERFNSKVNAIVSLQPRDALLTQADARDAQLGRRESMGWMHGFPHAVKDLAATKGIRTTWGSPLLDTVPRQDSLFVERLRRSGAILIGKTNAPEFGLGSQTYNPVFGATRNAYDQTKTSGGSSGGASAAIALRMLPVADGSDMMGSLRNPTAYNNVMGLRTSFGRVPARGGELYLEQLSVDGPIGRSAADVARLLSVMAGPDQRFPLSIQQDPAIFTQPLERDFKGTRLAWLGNLGGHLPMEPGILELCEKSFPAFESIGCTIEAASLDYSPKTMWDCWLVLRHWLVAGGLAALYSDPEKRKLMKPEAQWEVAGGLPLTGMQAYAASEARSAIYRALLAMFEKYDYLLIPSAQVFQFDVNIHWPAEINGVAMDTYHRWMEVVILGSLSGGPTINVPVGFNGAGLPMGMQIIGRNQMDFAVLQLAHAY